MQIEECLAAIKLTVNFWQEKDGTVSGSIPELSLSMNGRDKDDCIEKLYALGGHFLAGMYFSDDFPVWFKHKPSLFAYGLKWLSTPSHILIKQLGYTKEIEPDKELPLETDGAFCIEENERGKFLYSFMPYDMPESLKAWKIKHELHMTPDKYAEVFGK